MQKVSSASNKQPGFRTFELSDPSIGLAGLRFVTVKSPSLKRRADIVLYVPDTAEQKKDLPLILLLHGVYGSAWAWALSGAAHLAAEKLIRQQLLPDCIIAMPSDGLWGDGSGYLAHGGCNYEKWIIDEVPAAARMAVPALSEKSPLFIAGLSMGGYGAIRIGAKYGHLFRGISGHSSITAFEQLSLFVEEPLDAYEPARQENKDLADMLCHAAGRLPPLRFDCGKNDLLIEPNRLLHRQLEEKGIAHQYLEFDGEHNWDYWKTHISDTLVFFSHLL